MPKKIWLEEIGKIPVKKCVKCKENYNRDYNKTTCEFCKGKLEKKKNSFFVMETLGKKEEPREAWVLSMVKK